MKIFQVWINIGIDDRHSICLYIMPLTTSSSGTHGTSRAREYSLGRMVQIDHYDFYGFVKIRITRAKKAKIEEEHYHEQSRNKK